MTRSAKDWILRLHIGLRDDRNAHRIHEVEEVRGTPRD